MLWRTGLELKVIYNNLEGGYEITMKKFSKDDC